MPLSDSTSAPAEERLPEGLRPESLPRHVALVMDGNSRWAAARGLPATDGHEHGMRALEKTLQLSRAWGIRVLTAFGFSLENWNRSKPEVDFLMALIERFINGNLADFLREGTRLRIIGDRTRLPTCVQKTIRDAEEATRNNSQLDLVLAISYSGRMDIVQACRKLAQKVDAKLLRPEDIDESLFADELQTSGAADESSSCPDLLVRTSGELRLSNFLLWQSAYSELFFTDTLWPDFGEAEYLQALKAFQSRDRRFGTRK
ncbi:cis-prenyltransferase 4, chloroplastic-like [Hordeum vulgare subsp. vulgare]|uniref:Alkyl transferase n=1 Tax=Hordeum vulgare subsp. vulgare TaxID=112509 RepID=A0A8I6X6U6_HORVV|nr:cis-prenyltransferase 4, chloroplastic-like [Hordeum vulgare subsp. vulgare]